MMISMVRAFCSGFSLRAFLSRRLMMMTTNMVRSPLSSSMLKG